MKRLFWTILLLPFLLSSCATIFNGTHTPVRVHSKLGEIVTFTNDSAVVDTGWVLPDGVHQFSALRGRNPITVEIKGDTTTQKFLLRATDSWVYYLNLMQPYAIGMIIDLFSPKRYTYPSDVYPKPTKKKGYRMGYTTVPSLKKGDVSLTFLPPILNAYMLKPVDYDFSGNVLGAGLGANYSYSDKSFFSAECIAATAWITYPEPYYEHSNNATRKENLMWVALAARHHHALGRFDLGYGVSLTWQHANEKYDYGRSYTDPNYGLVRENNYFTLGGSFSANYRLSRSVYLGINYQPQILSFTLDGAALTSAHTANAGLFWRVPIPKNH
ncbi:MAG: hypothetical protein KF744_11770 [Taibaiella sp.]|nr:hypothetical protein [Taibaiella sp.]